MAGHHIVVIGGSAGGVEAMKRIEPHPACNRSAVPDPPARDGQG
jgi:NADH dehydrogenase FAD-containing subunit